MLKFLNPIKWVAFVTLFVPPIAICFFYRQYQSEVEELHDQREFITDFTASLYPRSNAEFRQGKERLANQLHGLGFFKKSRFLYHQLIQETRVDDPTLPELKKKLHDCEWQLLIHCGDHPDNDEVDINRINTLPLKGYSISSN